MRTDTSLASAVGLYQQFRQHGYNFFTGVPCSGITPFINDLRSDPEMTYIPAPREDVALAIAVGATLAGKKPLVFLQSSGLGHLVNPITSLLKPYGISVHLLISLRAKPFEHFFMHKITERLLELLELRGQVTIVEEQACDA